MLKTTLKKDGDNKHLLIEEKETITITMTRGISNVIAAISWDTIALNVKGKLYQRYMNNPTTQRKIPPQKDQLY